MTTFPKTIKTVEDARQLVAACIDANGFGYHQDTEAADYVEPPANADEWDQLHAEAFEAGFADELYDHGMKLFSEVAWVIA